LSHPYPGCWASADGSRVTRWSPHRVVSRHGSDDPPAPPGPRTSRAGLRRSTNPRRCRDSVARLCEAPCNSAGVAPEALLATLQKTTRNAAGRVCALGSYQASSVTEGERDKFVRRTSCGRFAPMNRPAGRASDRATDNMPRQVAQSYVTEFTRFWVDRHHLAGAQERPGGGGDGVEERRLAQVLLSVALA
jgi:hypothetical protein